MKIKYGLATYASLHSPLLVPTPASTYENVQGNPSRGLFTGRPQWVLFPQHACPTDPNLTSYTDYSKHESLTAFDLGNMDTQNDP